MLLGIRDRLIRRGDYVWGSFMKPERVDGYVVGVNPGDRSDVLGRFSFSESSVDDAVTAAARARLMWSRLEPGERAVSLRRYREALSTYQEPLAVLLTRETGKPLWEARHEVVGAMRAVDLLLEEGVGLLRPRVLDEREARSDYRPRGVVGVIAPYSLPLLTGTLHTAASIYAGNAVVYKPSKFTPGVGQAIAELFDRCKLPRGVFNMIQGSGSGTGHKLAMHPGLDALLFTGSYQTATTIRRATAERAELPSVYQCGGKGSGIVLPGCDIDRTVYEVLVGAFLSSGQRHNSTGRVFVHKDVFEAFCEQLVRRAARVKVGYGFDEDTLVGPLISENFRNRYRRYGRAVLQRGHTTLLEGGTVEVSGRRGFYAGPAVYWVNWENGHPFMNDEPPGPTLLVYRVSSWEEAVGLHNQLIYRVTTSIFLDEEAERLTRDLSHRLSTGALNVNRGTVGASLRLPSVGLGRSSNGIPGGIDLLRFLSTPRSTLVERRPFDPSLAVPGVNWEPLDESPDLSAALEPDVQDSP